MFLNITKKIKPKKITLSKYSNEMLAKWWASHNKLKKLSTIEKKNEKKIGKKKTNMKIALQAIKQNKMPKYIEFCRKISKTDQKPPNLHKT